MVGIEVGPTGANDKDQIFYSRASGKEIVANLVRARVEYAVIFMKDQDFAYYNSAVVRQCPNLGGRDLLREVLDEARKAGILIVAYFQIQYDGSAWNAHPDWRMQDVTGKDIPGRLCYNSGYLEYSKKGLEELLKYEISGFHVDMLDYGFGPPYGCWCKHCQSRFRQKYNMEMPRPEKPSWDENWEKILEFRADSNTRFCQDVHAFVKSKRPEVAVDFNYHGYPPFSWFAGQLPVKHAMNGDFVTAEGLPWAFGHNNPSLLALFLAGARLGGPTQIATSRSVYDYFDPTIRPVAEMKWEVLLYAAHGTQCTVVDKVNYDGTLDPLAYERLGEVFGEVREKRDYFKHKPVQEVGLYYSSRSRDWYGRENAPKYFAAFSGAHLALIQSHIPLGMIMDENVSLDRLREFPVVYVPNAAILSKKELGLFDEYVSGGGNLLVTGLSGLYDRFGIEQSESAISQLLGVRLGKVYTEYNDNYVRLPGQLKQGEGAFLLQDIPVDWPVPTWGPVAAFEATGAQSFGELMVAFRASPELRMAPLSAGKVIGPAVFIGERGKGKVVYLPCCPDNGLMTNYRIPENRNLIRNIIRYLNPRPWVKVTAPPNAEIVVTHDEPRRRLLVHFVCFHAPATATAAAFPKGRLVVPPIMEEALNYEARIEVNGKFSKAEAVGRGSRVSVEGNKIRLATSSVHDVLVIHV